MKHVRLSITAGGREDEIHPVYDMLVNASFVEYATAINANFTGDELGILHYVEGDPDRFAARLAEISVIREFDIERLDDERFYLYIWDETTPPMNAMFDQFTDDSLVVAPPMIYTDGTVTVSLYGQSERIQAAIEVLPAFVSVTVEEISGLRGLPGTEPAILSDRQREAVERALELGYYEIPREASHEEVATALGCAPSTAAEHLRKAESKLLKSLFGKQMG